MTSLLQFLQFNFLARSADFALLVLRVWVGLSLLLLHGWSKLLGYTKAADFPDPLGVGPRVSWALATLGETVCPALVVLGLAARFGALGAGITMGTAFVTAHGMKLQGMGNGELPFIYLAGFATIFLAGAGRFSFDRRFGGA